MTTIRLGLAAVLATLTMIAGTAGEARAADDPYIGMQVLDLLCTAKGGTPYNTPMTIARCQEVRSNKGFAIEQLVCEGLLDASFKAAPSYGRPKRTTWVCVSYV